MSRKKDKKSYLFHLDKKLMADFTLISALLGRSKSDLIDEAIKNVIKEYGFKKPSVDCLAIDNYCEPQKTFLR